MKKLIFFSAIFLLLIASFVVMGGFFMRLSSRTKAAFDLNRDRILQLSFENEVKNTASIPQTVVEKSETFFYENGAKGRAIKFDAPNLFFLTTTVGLNDLATISFWFRGYPNFFKGEILTINNPQQTIKIIQKTPLGFSIQVNGNDLTLSNQRKIAFARNYQNQRLFNLTLVINTRKQKCLLYLDGEIDYKYGFSIFDCPISSLAGSSLMIGNKEGKGFQGIVDELSIWKKELNQQEVVEYIKETYDRISNGKCEDGENSLISPADCQDKTNLSYRLVENNDYVIWAADPLIKIWQNKALPRQSRNKIQLALAKNEKRIFQLVLTGKSSVNPFFLPNEISLSSPNPNIKTEGYYLHYLKVSSPSYNYYLPRAVINSDNRPDALIPLNYYSNFFNQNQIRVSKDNHTVFVFEIFALPQVSAGRQLLTLKIKDIQIPVEVTILNFNLPEQPSVKTFYNTNINNTLTIKENSPLFYHGLRNNASNKSEKISQLLSGYLEAYIDHRIAPYSLESFPEIGSLWSWFDCQSGRLNSQKKEILRRYLDLYLNKKKMAAIELTHINGYEYFDQRLAFCGLRIDSIERPINYLNITYEEYKRNYLNQNFVNLISSSFGDLAFFLRENNWLNKVYLFADEPIDPGVCGGSETWCVYRIRALAEIINPLGFNLGPLLPNPKYLDPDKNNSIIEKGDWFNLMGVSHNLSQDRAQNRQPLIYTGKTGSGELWWYHTDHDAFDIDSEAIETLSLYWQMYYYNIPGSLQWAFIGWAYEGSNPWVVLGNRWGGNGNIILFYPPCRQGPCNELNFQIIPSLRLKLIREAINDHSYLTLLENRIGRSRVVNDFNLDAIFNNLKTWDERTLLLHLTRERIRQALDPSYLPIGDLEPASTITPVTQTPSPTITGNLSVTPVLTLTPTLFQSPIPTVTPTIISPPFSQEINIFKAKGNFIVDGFPLEIDKIKNNPTIKLADTDVFVLWKENSIYLAFEIDDKDIVTYFRTSDCQNLTMDQNCPLWREDSIEIFFSQNSEQDQTKNLNEVNMKENDYQFVISLSGNRIDLKGQEDGRSTFSWTTDWSVKSTIMENGKYFIETVIPVNKLNSQKLFENQKVLLSVVRNDFDSNGQSSSYGWFSRESKVNQNRNRWHSVNLHPEEREINNYLIY